MIIRLQILINKMVSFFIKIAKMLERVTFGRLKEKLNTGGSVLPAHIALKLDKNALDNIIYPELVIGVTGSTGKGSTTKMIYNILKENNLKVITNKSGSNMINGVATLLLNNTCFFNKKLKGDVLLLELDEAFVANSIKKGAFTHLVITNITRDQVTRNVEPDYMLNKIMKDIDKNTKLIINGDDVILNKLTELKDFDIKKFGLNKTKASYSTPNYNSLDGVYCPLCNSKLKYDFYHYIHLGSFKCPNCHFQRKLDYTGENIDLDKKVMTINSNIYNLNNSFLFIAYNTLAAYALAKELQIDEKVIKKGLKSEETLGKDTFYQIGKKKIYLLVSKNETVVSYNQTIKYISKLKKESTVILGFDKVSRRYNYNDLSWLYDVEFSLLNNKNVKEILIFGKLKNNIELALLNNGVEEDKIKLIESENIFDQFDYEEEKDLYFITCFESINFLNNEIKKKLGIK